MQKWGVDLWLNFVDNKVEKHDLKAYLSIPYNENFVDIKNILSDALEEIKIAASHIEYLSTNNILNKLKLEIMNADIMIADVTNSNPNILYQRLNLDL